MTGDGDGQLTLEGFDSDDDRADDLRAEVDQLKDMMETLVETHQDLADTVATLADTGEDAARDGDDGTGADGVATGEADEDVQARGREFQ